MDRNSRKSPRAWFLDYDAGTYFVTICTLNHRHFFGEIINKEMHLSPIGKIVNDELASPHIHHKDVEVPLFVVMPNHIHAIVICRDIACDVSNAPSQQRNPNPSYRGNPDMARHVPTLSRYIASLKSAVSRRAHQIDASFKWQPRYHDHLIRRNRDGTKIGDYIVNNVNRWESDCFNVPVEVSPQ